MIKFMHTKDFRAVMTDGQFLSCAIICSGHNRYGHTFRMTFINYQTHKPTVVGTIMPHPVNSHIVRQSINLAPARKLKAGKITPLDIHDINRCNDFLGYYMPIYLNICRSYWKP